MNNAFSLILKYLFPFTSWFFGVYIALFVMCFYAHVNESNIIANRADALLTKIAHGEKSGLASISSVQNMVRKTKPSFFEPYTIIRSLLGEREPYKLINKLLGNAIENRKAELAGIDLGPVDLEAADLSNSNMHRVILTNANLLEANLSGANLSRANLSEANLSEANLSEANLSEANLSEANLSGANLSNTKLAGANLNKANFKGAYYYDNRVYIGAINPYNDLRGSRLDQASSITCAQIKSAIIDENTRLPDYISLTWSSETTYKCKNTLNKN